MADDRKYSLSNYPLAWPDGWRRLPESQRRNAQFKRKGSTTSYSTNANITPWNGIERVIEQLRLMGVSRDDLVISTNIPTRLDGLPRSDAREPADPGAAVYWNAGPGTPTQCIGIDIYLRVADNLCGIAATLEALRAIERHGGAQVQERTFRGFQALAAKTGNRPWREVLFPGAHPNEPITAVGVENAFRYLAKQEHPDVGGSHEAMAELNLAREEALREIGL